MFPGVFRTRSDVLTRSARTTVDVKRERERGKAREIEREKERRGNTSRSSPAEYLLYVRLLNKHAVVGGPREEETKKRKIARARARAGEKSRVNDEKCHHRGEQKLRDAIRPGANILNLITPAPLKWLQDSY